MRRILNASAIAVLAAGTACPDIMISTSGAAFTAFTGANPGGGANSTVSTPYWNQGSDGTGNAGAFLSAVGNFTGQTAYIGTSTGQYLGQAGAQADQPSNFGFVRESSLLTTTVLFTSAGQNGGAFGTTIGIYDLTNTASRTVLYGPGSFSNNTAPTSGDSVNGTTVPGSFNAGNGPGGGTPPSASVNTPYAQWGFYATTCTDPVNGTGCNTYFSGTPGSDLVGANGDVLHQHFALFRASSTSNTYFLALEDFFGQHRLNGQLSEGSFGDYNDVILQFAVGGNDGVVPEPATWTILSLGLVGIGSLRRTRKS